MAVKSIKVEKNRLLVKVAGTFDGTSIKLDYQGRPYGNKIKGQLTYDIGDNAGKIEFTATRKPVKKKPAKK